MKMYQGDSQRDAIEVDAEIPKNTSGAMNHSVSEQPVQELASPICELEGPPPTLSSLIEVAAEQFGTCRTLKAGHKDYGLANQFRRMEKLWLMGSRDALWFGALSSSQQLAGLAVVTKPGTAWSNRSFGGGPAFSEFAYAFTNKRQTLGLSEFTLGVLKRLPSHFYPVRVYGYALSQSVGYWSQNAPKMGAVAGHNILGVPTWMWLHRSLVGVNLVDPTEGARAVQNYADRYWSGPAIDSCVLRSIGTVREWDSPFAAAVTSSAGLSHSLSVTAEEATRHRQRVAAAFQHLPPAIQTPLSKHFARIGLLNHGRQATRAFWLRFAPTVLLEDNRNLWPMLDVFTKVRRVAR